MLFYFFDSAIETFLNSFRSFSSSKEDFLALVPALLLPSSNCELASVRKDSKVLWMFSMRFFMIVFLRLRYENSRIICVYLRIWLFLGIIFYRPGK